VRCQEKDRNAKSVVFSRENPGSDIWWIRYKVNGAEYREKVGRFKDAVDLYRIRRSDALRGAKMPANMKNKGVKFKVIGLHALDWYIEHGRKDVKNFRIRMNIILKDFGDRIADEIKPSEIDAWLKGHDWSPATKNRYKNVFGKAFKIAFADGKVSGNPARLVEQRPEKNARLRFLSSDEEAGIREAINIRCPRHMPEFDIALNTGMRRSEQYSLEWGQFSFRRKRILLDETKNGSSREIPMNKSCLRAFEELYAIRMKAGSSNPSMDAISTIRERGSTELLMTQKFRTSLGVRCATRSSVAWLWQESI
jgi:integrase